MPALKWANIIFTTSNLFLLRSGGDREFDVVTWWSVFLTLCLPVSFLCCLFLCVSLSPFVEWWTVKCWCWFCDFIFPINLLRHLPIWSIFLCLLNSETSFFSLIAEDTNWFPKENMFSFQTATTTMQAWVSSSCAHTHTNIHSHNYARSAVWKVKVNVPCQCFIQLPRNRPLPAYLTLRIF